MTKKIIVSKYENAHGGTVSLEEEIDEHPPEPQAVFAVKKTTSPQAGSQFVPEPEPLFATRPEPEGRQANRNSAFVPEPERLFTPREK